jgi:HAD superfamily hydrolase (TIGR01509 family)
MMAIKGLIFDFDGLILDTETPEYDDWQDIFQSYGAILTLDEWKACLGIPHGFDPVGNLTQKTGLILDSESMLKEHHQRTLDRIHCQPPRPGIPETLAKARELGLKLGVASSSSVRWVFPLLKRLGIFDQFDVVLCRDHVEKIKPDPELFLTCAAKLGVAPSEAIVFEDSPTGISAANAAGIFCVAVPNLLTGQLDIDHANLRLERIDQIPLEELLKIPLQQ